MKIADICPLIFNPLKNPNKQDIDYIQKFYVSDTIMLQAFAEDSDDNATTFTLKNLSEGTESAYTWNSYAYNDDESVLYYGLTGLEDGIYSVVIGGLESEPFEVSSSDLLLQSTTLLQFSHKDNSSSYFDNIFWFGDTQQIFSLRVEGGLSYNSAKVENEQYRNQLQEIVELYAVPYDTYTLSIGDASGVPYWFAQLLNRILCLSKMEINDISYVRSGSSEIEITVVAEESQLYTISVQVERLDNGINGIGGTAESGSVSVAGFSITNPQEGEVLKYSTEQSAFVNTDTI